MRRSRSVSPGIKAGKRGIRRRIRVGLDLLILLSIVGFAIALFGGLRIEITISNLQNPCFILAGLLSVRALWGVVTVPRKRLLRLIIHLLLALGFLLTGLYDRGNRFVVAIFSVPHRLTAPSPARKVTYEFPSAAVGMQPRNLILVTLDTLRADHLGCYGYRRNTSPHLDHLARAGMRFENVIAQMPVTVPSHAAILTGCYPVTVKVLTNAHLLPKSATTAAQRLQSRGFTTGGFVSSAVLRREVGFARGFGTFVDEISGTRRNETLAPVRVNDALHWLAEIPSDEPFFLWLHLFDPHAPYEPPEVFDNLFRPLLDLPPDTSLARLNDIFRKKTVLSNSEVRAIVDSYDGEVAYMDRALGHLFAWLVASPHATDTLVAVIADHGEELYDHDFFVQHNQSLYQGTVRIPLLIWFAGIQRGGESSSIPIETVDLLPTLLDLLGVPYNQEDMDGGSFAAVLTTENTKWNRRVQVTRREVTRAFPPAQAVLANGYKYIHFGNPARGDELFNLARDSQERANLVEEEPARAAALRTVLESHYDLRLKAEDSPPPELSEEQRRILEALGYTH